MKNSKTTKKVYKKVNTCAACGGQFVCKSGGQKYCSVECAGNPVSGEVVFIYSLSDPRTGEVFYIGKTDRSPQRRLREHLSQIHRHEKYSCTESPVRAQIYVLWKFGLKPTITTIELCTKENWAERESFWINSFRERNPNLLNGNGGSGQPVLRAERVSAILNISVKEIRQLVKAGHLEGHKPGRDWLISRASVEAYKAERDKRLNNQAEK